MGVRWCSVCGWVQDSSIKDVCGKLGKYSGERLKQSNNERKSFLIGHLFCVFKLERSSFLIQVHTHCLFLLKLKHTIYYRPFGYFISKLNSSEGSP